MPNAISFDNCVVIDGMFRTVTREALKREIPKGHRAWLPHLTIWAVWAPYVAKTNELFARHGELLIAEARVRGVSILLPPHAQMPTDREQGHIPLDDAWTTYKAGGYEDKTWTQGEPGKHRWTKDWYRAFFGENRGTSEHFRFYDESGPFTREQYEELLRQQRAKSESRQQSDYRYRPQPPRMNGHRTDYDVLFVTRDAPQEVIAAAYRALSKLYHPDKEGDPRKMVELNLAYARIKK